MPVLADIFREHAQDYIDQHGPSLMPSQLRAIRDIQLCRTGQLGGHIYECDRCGNTEFSYHSCCNRSCPQCLHHRTEAWLEARRLDLLPVPYFHIIFTLPQEFRCLVYAHQKILYDILIKAAAKSLKKLARDPHYMGGSAGFYTVLHTWTQALLYHPHVHCLVPGGGVSEKDGQWMATRNNFYVPAKPLSKIFRAVFMKMVRKALPEILLPGAVWKQKWVIHIKRTVQKPESVLRYLGRYMHRIAITNRRILNLENGNVTFRYKDSKLNRWKTMQLPAIEFIGRFLKHVLPKGFHKVRYFGFLHPNNKDQLDKIKQELSCNGKANEILKESAISKRSPQSRPCRNCDKGTLILIQCFPRQLNHTMTLIPRVPP